MAAEAFDSNSCLTLIHRLDGLDDLYDYLWMQYFAGVERDYNSGAFFEIYSVAALSSNQGKAGG
jgi:hypothetical protein